MCLFVFRDEIETGAGKEKIQLNTTRLYIQHRMLNVMLPLLFTLLVMLQSMYKIYFVCIIYKLDLGIEIQYKRAREDSN